MADSTDLSVLAGGAVPLSEHHSTARENAVITLDCLYIGSDQRCQIFSTLVVCVRLYLLAAPYLVDIS